MRAESGRRSERRASPPAARAACGAGWGRAIYTAVRVVRDRVPRDRLEHGRLLIRQEVAGVVGGIRRVALEHGRVKQQADEVLAGRRQVNVGALREEDLLEEV